MKTKFEIQKIDWDFKIDGKWIKVRWEYLEHRKHVGKNLAFYKVFLIFPLHQLRVSELSYETCLNPNISNTKYFIEKILKPKS